MLGESELVKKRSSMHQRKKRHYSICRELSHRMAKDENEYFHFRYKLQCRFLCIFHFKSSVLYPIVSVDGCSQGKNVKTKMSRISNIETSNI